MLANPYFQKINTLYEKSSIEVEGKDFYLDILMGGDMKFCNLCLGWVNLYVIIPVHGIGSIKTTRGQKTCYWLGKIVLPRRQITRRKLWFYYICKFGVVSIKYVIIIGCSKHWNIILKSRRWFNLIVNKTNWKWSCFFFSALFNDMICV